MTVASRRTEEGGFALLLLFVLSAMIAITLYNEMPRVAFESQRNKEQMLIDRGEQYKRGIQIFYRKNKRFPATMDELEKFQDIRYVRRRFKDPLTGKDTWRLIHVGPGGMLTDSLVQKQQNPLGQSQSANGLNSNGQSSNPGFSSFGGQQNSGGFGSQQNSGFGSQQNSGFGSQQNAGNQQNGNGQNGQAAPPVQYNANGMPIDNGQNGQGDGGGQPSGINMARARRPSDRMTLGANTQQQVVQPANDDQDQSSNDDQDASQNGAQFPQQQAPGQQLPGQLQNQPYQGGQVPGQPPFPGQPGQPGQPGYPYQPGAPQQGYQIGQSVVPSQPLPFPGQNPNVPQNPNAPPNQNMPPAPNQPYNPFQQQQQFQQQQFQQQQQGLTNPNTVNLSPQNNPALTAVQNSLTSGRQQSSFNSGSNSNAPGVGAGIAGVASTFKGPSIKIIDKHQKYQEWEFVYDMKKDKSVMGAAGVNQMQNLQNQQNQNGQGPGQPITSFGSGSGSGFGSNSGSGFGTGGTTQTPAQPQPQQQQQQ